jgi:Holliday junction resolvase-like predicted endonuclease
MSDEYVLTVELPVTMTKNLAPEMITISARKENKLAIVADVWHAENNCERAPAPINCTILSY